MRVARLGDREFVAAVTGRTAAGTTIGINIAHAVVGPGLRCRAIVLIQQNFRAVTLHTTRFAGCTRQLWMVLAFMYNLQCMQVVLGNNLVVGTKVPRGIELLFGIDMTAPTHLG